VRDRERERERERVYPDGLFRQFLCEGDGCFTFVIGAVFYLSFLEGSISLHRVMVPCEASRPTGHGRQGCMGGKLCKKGFRVVWSLKAWNSLMFPGLLQLRPYARTQSLVFILG
jgi:hypothetical protein